MRLEGTEPAAESLARRETQLSAPTHVPSARNDTTQALDQVRRSAVQAGSLPSDANCRTTDYSATPTPTPLPSSTPTTQEQIRRIGKGSERSLAEKGQHPRDRSSH